MNEHDPLAALKSFTRTYIVHSNANPYAAAAAMGLLSIRSQKDGPYFQPSKDFIPHIHLLPPEDVDNSEDKLKTDFETDWVMFLRIQGMPACGLSYDERRPPRENTMRFLNAQNRRIPSSVQRTAHESRELVIPEEFRLDYEALLRLIRAGGDLKPYLSRDVLKRARPDKNDGLLNAWGIQHLHFRSEGTDQLLFCVVQDQDVFLIQTLPHRAEHLWVNTQLLQIVHDNWPHLIAGGRHGGLSPEHFSEEKRSSLRACNANFPVTVADGTVYLPPAGGAMASGSAQGDFLNCEKIFDELRYWRTVIVENESVTRTALGLPASRKLIIKMAFDNRTCCFYEATLGVRIALNMREANPAR